MLVNRPAFRFNLAILDKTGYDADMKALTEQFEKQVI